MVLLPQIADAVNIPVIAAGGIADGRGVVAAFSLGAEGIQMGTRFLCCTECNVHPNYKKKVLDAGDRGTVITGRTLGHPVRSLKNKFTQKFQELEDHCSPAPELEAYGAGKLRNAVVDGDVEFGSVMAGQSAGMVHEILPAAQIIRDIFEDAHRISLKGDDSFK